MERTNTYLNNIAYSLLMFFACVMMLSNAAAELLIGITMFIWIAQTIAYRRKNWMNYPLFIPITAFIGFKILTLLVNGYQGQFGINFEQIVLPLVYFIIPSIVVTVERRRKIIWLLIAGAVVASGVGMIKFYTGAVPRATSTISGCYTLAIYLSICLTIVLAILAYSKKLTEKLFFGLISIPLVLGIFLTFTRAVYISAALAAFILGIYKDRKMLAFIVLLVILIVTLAPQTGDILFSRFDLTNMKLFYSHRDVLLDFGLNEARDPGFFGNGLNSFTKLVDVPNEPLVRNKQINSWHNMYIQHLVDGGPFLMLTLLWIFIRQFKYSFDIFRKTRDTEQKIYQIAFIMILISVMVLGFFTDPLRDPIVSMLFWLLMGLSLIKSN